MFKSILFTALLFTASANAADLRALSCDKGHARLGDEKFKVIEKCGEPVMKEVLSGDNRNKVEQYIYKKNRMTYSMIFASGILQEITSVK